MSHAPIVSRSAGAGTGSIDPKMRATPEPIEVHQCAAASVRSCALYDDGKLIRDFRRCSAKGRGLRALNRRGEEERLAGRVDQR